jgi:hypothetical protein
LKIECDWCIRNELLGSIGCGSASPADAAQKLRVRASSATLVNDADRRSSLIASVRQFMSGLSHTLHHPGVLPLVCLSEDSIAISASRVHSPNGASLGIDLPTVAVAIHDRKHIVVVGHVAMLSACECRRPELSAFLEAITRFCGGWHSPQIRIVILDFPHSICDVTQQNLSAIGFEAVVRYAAQS